MITVRYFAWVRTAAGRDAEPLALPPEVTTLAALRDHLAARDPSLAAALGSPALRCALNRRAAPWDAPVAAGDEVAFFPPVTGG